MRFEPVARWRREKTGVDGRGDPIYKRVKTDLPPALFAPGGISEPVEPGREPTVMEPTLYWPKVWPDVVASDELEVRSKTWAVVGEPAEWRGSRVGGLTVNIRRSEEGVA